MEEHMTPEPGAKLTHSAGQKGRNPEELAQEILAQYLKEETRFPEAVQRGKEALQRGEYLTHEQVGPLCPVPHISKKSPHVFEAAALVKMNRLAIGAGHRQADAFGAVRPERQYRLSQ